MVESKFLKRKEKNKKNVFISFINKMFISILITLITLIIVKKDPSLKSAIKDKLFNSNFSFAKINKWYKEKFGSILPIDNIIPENTVSVFDEKLKYKSDSLYKDGVKLTVEDNYIIPFIQSGIVIFIGEKENYGKTIIIQQVDGIDVWYGNISDVNVKLYDYVEKGNVLGNCNNNMLYLVFQKDGKYLNYKEYI